ncbi:hypothetical protein [Natronorubrum texcoconense]|uniref:Uncharacterized protein n=1 Tax=Natronorubrum texcoconense TaxID=1095776 RepID=A0A1G8XIV1_9EURY|nr:hypothetical protein [Natronorubrum texcoconense]SDJ90347.1 hypothetical protein SAMN04515672_1770 [Natronorubrum texcoconense]
MVAVDDSVDVHVRTTVWKWPLYLMDSLLRDVEQIEADQSEKPSEPVKMEYTAKSAGCIISSAALLESVANTVIFDIEQGTPAMKRYEFDVEQVQSNIRSEYKSIYDEKDCSFIYAKVPKKYDKILEFSGSPVFTRHQNPYQNASIVTKLRNQAIHAKPEYVTTQAEIGDTPTYGEYQSLQGALQGKAAKNPYSNAPLFEFFSHGYAEWAAQSVLQLIDEFYSRLGVVPIYETSIEELCLNELR